MRTGVYTRIIYTLITVIYTTPLITLITLIYTRFRRILGRSPDLEEA